MLQKTLQVRYGQTDYDVLIEYREIESEAHYVDAGYDVSKGVVEFDMLSIKTTGQNTGTIYDYTSHFQDDELVYESFWVMAELVSDNYLKTIGK